MIQRRDFLKAAGVSAASMGKPLVSTAEQSSASASVPAGTKYPKLAIKTRYSPERLAFAASAGYEGVIVDVNEYFDPDKLTDSQTDQVLAAARDAGVRIISIESMVNHLAPDPAERRQIRARFVRCIELAHRLGCKFVGTFSGGKPGASVDEQAKELAEVLNEQYLPVCEKLDVRIGPENYPCDENFATVPASWEKVFALVPNHRFGLEFDPSHLVRQYIDPIQTAWDFRDRILAVHAKDTEIIQPVLAKVGIHGRGWWRYRIPGQGLIDWPKFITVLLQAGFQGGMAVEHEDNFWDAPHGDAGPEMAQERKDGFILAARFLRQYLPGRLS
ncbi:MAG: sugar phosphate isomerase/epimerase [Terriglobia bacterium]|jgi:sugar phosphate isomerase/epimerase